MSPEQIGGLVVDARSDLFSVGVMAFESLTGRSPFGGATHSERMASIEQDSENLASGLRGAPGLQAALRRCLARSPNDRFNSAAELQAELIPRMEELQAPLAIPELSNNSAELWNKNPA